MLIFFTTDLTDFDIRLHGKVPADSDIVFEIQRLGDKLKIEVNFNGSVITGNLTLDVAIPKKIYKEIFVSTFFGDINLKEDIEAQKLIAESSSGNIYTSAKLKEISITTMNGEVTTVINARDDIRINVITTNGNVHVELNNIRRVDILTFTMNGRVTKNTITDGRRTIEGTISTINGNINIS